MAEFVRSNFDLWSLFHKEKTTDIAIIRGVFQTRLYEAISRMKRRGLFRSGTQVRDLYSELLIPKHITSTWNLQGELRAIK